MKGAYNGSYMRAYKIIPLPEIKAAQLSTAALKKLTWFDYYHTHGKNISLTCRHFGISRDTFYLWKKRFNPYHLSSLEDDTKTRRPHSLRQMTTPKQVIDLVIKLRSEDPEKSKYEIQVELREKYAVSLGYNTIQKIINRHPQLLNTQHQKKVQRYRNYKISRIRAAKELKEKFLGSLVQVDTKHVYIFGSKYYVFCAIDCKSRLAFTYAYTSISSKSAADFLTRLTSYFPFPIQAVNTDNGSEYLLNFHQLTQKLGIPHYFSYPHTPKMNSRAERLIQTLEYEFLNYQDLLPEINQLRSLCEAFNTKYNSSRYHQALGYQTPANYVKTYLQLQGG